MSRIVWGETGNSCKSPGGMTVESLIIIQTLYSLQRRVIIACKFGHQTAGIENSTSFWHLSDLKVKMYNTFPSLTGGTLVRWEAQPTPPIQMSKSEA